MMVSILLVEDDPLAAACIKYVLKKSTFGCAIQWCRKGVEALHACKEHYDFHIAIIDCSMEECDSAVICQALHQHRTELPVLALVTHLTKELEERMTNSGVQGVLLKDSIADIESTISEILKFGSLAGFKTPAVIAQKVEMIITKQELTFTENQVLFHYKKGLRDADIAELLGNAPATIRKHKQHICQKMKCHSMKEVLLQHELRSLSV